MSVAAFDREQRRGITRLVLELANDARCCLVEHVRRFIALRQHVVVILGRRVRGGETRIRTRERLIRATLARVASADEAADRVAVDVVHVDVGDEEIAGITVKPNPIVAVELVGGRGHSRDGRRVAVVGEDIAGRGVVARVGDDDLPLRRR